MTISTSPVQVFPPKKSVPSMSIGVIFCATDILIAGREREKLADCEVIDVAHAVTAALQKEDHRVEPINLSETRIEDLRKFDWIFNLAETICGFPYTEYDIAEMLETYRIGFTGSGSSTMRDCQDKALTKARLLQHGILTPAYELYRLSDRVQTSLTFPLFVKPVHEDGSIGIADDSIVSTEGELAGKVQEIHRVYHQAALVEEYIEGRDITTSILGNGREAEVMPLSECVYLQQEGSKFLTFESKWVDESPAFRASMSTCPCELDPEVEVMMKAISLQCFQIMGCQDYARVDFRLKGRTPYVLEVNPNPCINPQDSGFVRSGKAAGFNYDDLVVRILEVSVNK